MSESPEAMRKRNMAAVRPLSDWAKTKERSGTRGSAGGGDASPPSAQSPLVHELGGIGVRHGLRDGERIFGILHRLAVKLAAVRLVILLARRRVADLPVDREPRERL